MFARSVTVFAAARGASLEARQKPKKGMGIGMSEIAAHSGLGPFDPYWTDDAPRPGRDRRGWGRRVALGLAAGVALVGVDGSRSGAVERAEPRFRARRRRPCRAKSSTRPSRRFSLSKRETAPARVTKRGSTSATGARRDAYSLGALEGDAPALRVEMWKDARARGAGSLFVEIAEETAAFGAAVERLGISQMSTSSQGPVEWADLTLAGGRGNAAASDFVCVARADGGLHGVACAGAGAKIDAGALSCLVDRLALTRAGREAGFERYREERGIRRPSCRAAIG